MTTLSWLPSSISYQTSSPNTQRWKFHFLLELYQDNIIMVLWNDTPLSCSNCTRNKKKKDSLLFMAAQWFCDFGHKFPPFQCCLLKHLKLGNGPEKNKQYETSCAFRVCPYVGAFCCIWMLNEWAYHRSVKAVASFNCVCTIVLHVWHILAEHAHTWKSIEIGHRADVINVVPIIW